MEIKALEQDFTVCQVADYAQVDVYKRQAS